MKRILLGLLTFFAFTQNSRAHPLDISINVFDIDSKTEVLSVSTYLHPFEVGYLLNNHNIEIASLADAYQHKTLIFEHILDHVKVKNEEKECEFISANLPPKSEFELMGDGLEVQYEIKCEDDLGIIEFSNNLFAEDFELQTNKILFYQDGNYKKTIYEKILTSKVINDSFDYNNPGKNLHPDQDTDWDGLTDHEENLYMTNLKITDTDFDGYSDKIEVDAGWDPRNPVASMWQIQIIDSDKAKQKQIEAILAEVESEKNKGTWTIPQNKTTKTIQTNANQDNVVWETKAVEQKIAEKTNITKNSSQAIENNLPTKIQKKEEKDRASGKKQEIPITTVNIPKKDGTPQGSDFFGTSYLTNFLKEIQTLLEQKNFFGKILVLFLAFFLWILHSLEPGHGKSILISYLIDQKKTHQDALRFAWFMTFTHLVDVIVLGICFKIFSMVGNTFDLISLIQKWGAYLLILISTFLILRTVFNFKTPRFLHNGKALGIASGLAPCTIGWALMIAMLSIGQINWLFPVILCFGLGIFFSLMIMSFLILKTKKKIIKNGSKLAKISSLASALLLFIFAISLL